MLKLKDINKIYTSKKGHTTNALIDINLSFSNTRLVFVLGPSGCGKSTLLNILGAIDSPTSGSLIVNNQELKQTNRNTNSYRNNYISFIFQEFNLIPDITVYDNLSLICFKNSKKDVDTKIAMALAEVGLSGFEDRYPNELSGGEIQRIAIARAFIKESKVILADEPTGNLNKENGEIICDLLKKLSKDKLVIIATHNEEFAIKYSDRILRMEDGKIIDDTNTNVEIINPTNSYESPKRYSLSLNFVFKFAIKNLLYKKNSFITSLFTIILCFAVFVAAFTVVNFNRPYVDYINIQNNNIERFLIKGNQDINNQLTNHKANEITEFDFDYIKNSQITSTNHLISMGYELYDSYTDIDDQSIIVSDIYLRSMVHHGRLFTDTKNLVEVKKNELDIANSNNYYVLLDDGNTFCRIAGVYKTLAYQTDLITDIYSEEYDSVFSNETDKNVFYPKDGIYHQSLRRLHYFNVGREEKKYQFNVNIQNRIINIENKSILTDDNIGGYDVINDNTFIQRSENNKLIEENQIYLSLDLYNYIFQEESTIFYYLGDEYHLKDAYYNEDLQVFTRDLLRQPTRIGKTITIEISQNDGSDSLQIKDLIVAGIIVNDDEIMVISTKNRNNINDFTINNDIIIKTSSVDELLSFFKYLHDDNNLYPSYMYTRVINNFEEDVKLAQLICGVIVLVMGIVIILIINTFTGKIIKAREKEYGILRSIGVRIQDISKIYILQIIIIIVLSLLLSSGLSLIIVNITNNLIIGDYSKTLQLLNYRGVYVLLILLINLVLNIATGIIAIYPTLHKKPYEIIRQS